jgi:hypothetical protein
MNNEKMQCPKCKGEMVQGFVPEYSHAAALLLGWHPGQPTKSSEQRCSGNYSVNC